MSSETFRTFLSVMIVIAFLYFAVITRYEPVDEFSTFDRWSGEMLQD